jgi:Tfp pilus assembly pilus retraction ATPase PilT
VQGIVRALPEPVLDGGEIEESVLPALPPHAAAKYRQHGIADAWLRRITGGRFRVNLHRKRGRADASIRALPLTPPQLADLRLPSGLEALTRLPHGLVLVGGPTGSGKTTTVAALVDIVNSRDANHVTDRVVDASQLARHTTKRCLRYVGAHSGCGCGFMYNGVEPGSDERREVRSAYADLAAYLWQHAAGQTVEIYT